MTKLFSYSFSLTSPPPKPALREYNFNEFRLALPSHWQQMQSDANNALVFYSADAGASITISSDFYEIPEDKAQSVAEQNVASRLAALEQRDPGGVVTLRNTMKLHSSGKGLEISLAAEVPDKYVYLFLGYVTSRKVLNFTLVCQPGKEVAATLFNEIISHYGPLLP